MGLLNQLFGSREPAPKQPEHAVIVAFDYGLSDLQPMFDLEERLEAAISAAGTGEFDGNEIAVDRSDGTFWMYGPDADALLASVMPVLLTSSLMRGARVTRRYGPPADGVREETTRLPSPA
jgi:hypothetical protein